MNPQAALQHFGYPANQVRIYLACLQMGESNIADICEQVDMPRTTVTELLAEMHKRGLMNYYSKKGRKFWVAENPDKLMLLVKEREAILKAILPQLHALEFEGDAAKPSIRLFIGPEEIKTMLDDMIESRQHIRAVVSWDDFKECFGDDFVTELIERRYTHFLEMHLITPDSVRARELKLQDGKQLRQTRFLPDHIELRRTSTFIYGNTVTLISLNRKQPTGILIRDPDVAHGQNIYFESLWSHSTDK